MRNMCLPRGLPTFEAFLGIWICMVQLVASWEPLSHLSSVFTQFHLALSHLLNHGSLITHIISYQHDPSLDEGSMILR